MNKIESIRATVERAVRIAQAGDTRRAESICRDALHSYPDDGNLLCLLGALLVRQRHPKDAESYLRRAVELYPDSSQAHEELGNALMAQDKIDEAVDCFRNVIELEPQNAQAHLKLSKMLAKSRSGQDAASTRQIAMQMDPTQEAIANANQMIDEDRIAEAEAVYRDLYLQDRENPKFLHQLGRLAMAQRHYRDAAILLRKAAEFESGSVAILNDLSRVLFEREAYEEATDVLSHSLEVDAEIAATYMLYGNALTKLFRFGDAAIAYQAGLDIDVGHVGCLAGLGHVLQALGRHDEAIQVYRRWVGVDPGAGEAWWSLSGLSGYEFDARDIDTIKTHIEDDNVSEEARINFCFALARTYDKAGDYPRAFEYYRAGNNAQRQREKYDSVETEVMHERIVSTFSPEMLGRERIAEIPAATPIFIVGMPRSGSTLIEQILASHSQVDGTQELPALGQIIDSISRDVAAATAYPEAVLDFDDAMIAGLGEQYLDFTRRYRSDRPFFTDKMPNNFSGIGLIHISLPNAKVIDTRRHPLDVCLGCYQQLFAQGQAFTYDLVELGEYYLQYRKMMDYWQQVLPNRILEVEYENLVADPEFQIHRLLDYCGLPWDDQCMRFYETDRIVNTASAEQVRRPIYRSAVNRWQNYENQLRDLIELLKPKLQQLPEDQRPASLSR